MTGVQERPIVTVCPKETYLTRQQLPAHRGHETALLAILSVLLIFACHLPGAGVPATISIPVITASSETPPPQGVLASSNGISFNIPGGLASSFTPEQIARVDEQSGAPWEVAPEHVKFTLGGYALPQEPFHEPQILIYPAQEYAAVSPGADQSLKRLQAILTNAAPPTAQNLPSVPYFNAAQMFAAQIQVISFNNGSGVRLLTQYGQAVAPINNNEMFYHFEGLTSDGQYYIVGILPVVAPFLAANHDPAGPLPADGVPFPGYENSDPTTFENYFNAVADKLNATSAESFYPSLVTLDALIQSLSVFPP